MIDELDNSLSKIFGAIQSRTGNLRAVQEHLRHADIQTTTLYTRLTQQDLQQVVGVFDQAGG